MSTQVKAKSAPKETPKVTKKAPSTVKKEVSEKVSPSKAVKETKVSRRETLKISVKAFEHRVVDEAVKKIISAAKDTGSQTVGPIPLPTKIEKFTLNRSTFVNKNAREQFEIRRHRRLLLINEPTPETLETLQKLNLPSGVGVDIAIVAAA